MERLCLRFKIAFVRLVHVSDAGTYRVEGLERAYKGAGRKYLDLDASIAGGVDRLCETDCTGSEVLAGVRASR